MPISALTTDYTGRTIDVSILQGVNPSGFATVKPMFGKIPNYCSGIQKLIQRYCIALLTQLGSQINFPDFGTSLMAGMNNRNITAAAADLTLVFNVANVSVITAFRNYQRGSTDPDDEKLNTAVLSNISATGDTVSLSITLYPEQQPAVAFVLPIPLSN